MRTPSREAPRSTPRSSLRATARTGSAIAALVVGALALPIHGATAQSTQANSAEAMLQQVFERLVAVADVPAELRTAWPPKLTYQSGPNKEINAFARCSGSRQRPAYEVVITPEIMQHVVKRDRDVLAFIVGHELAHVLLGHSDCRRSRDDQAEVVALATGRAQEMASDSLGMQLAVKAGYSFRRAVRGMMAMADAVGSSTISTVQSLVSTHPTWADRGTFASMVEGDRQMASLWRSMSAFANGNYFLMIEQYEAAARAFRQVTTEFPDAHEAWANLGFALLMLYADALDADDLIRFDVGQIVMPGFYRRPESLEAQVRGIKSELWWEAVGALREAIRYKPDLTLAYAHLGIAYLIHPSGTRDIGNATKFLKQAAELATNDPAISVLDRVAIEINAGVAEMAAGGEATAIFDQALEALVASTSTSGARRSTSNNFLAAAIDYNRALLLENSRTANAKRDAVQMMERYLGTALPASTWWQIGYQRYVSLCQAAGVRAKPAEEFRKGRAEAIRTVAGIEVVPGATVNLGDPIADATKQLGKAARIPAVSGTNLVLFRYDARGVDLLAGDRVLAIVVRGPNAPKVPLRAQGIGGATTADLHIGMSVEELTRIAGEFYDMKRLTSDDVYYRYYRDLGIGVRIVDARVAEIVIAQIPTLI